MVQINEQLESAIRLHQAGDLSAAARGYSAILDENPQVADAWHLSGVIAIQQKAFDDAERMINVALDLQPRQPVYLSNLAAAYLGSNRNSDAESVARQALQSDKFNVRSRKHLASALSRQKRYREAADVLESAVRDAPEDADVLCNLGAVLFDLQEFDHARQMLTRAVVIAPESVQIRVNLGAVLHECGCWTDALEHLNAAVELGPDIADCFNNRGNTLLSLKHTAEALDDFQRALAINPQSALGLNGLARSLQDLGYWIEAMEAFALACRLEGPVSRFDSNRLYCASLAPQIDRKELFELHRSWGQAVENQAALLPVRRYQHDRVRVGYVSPDFYDHATMRFFLPMLEAHDTARFEIYCYFEGREDRVSRRVQEAGVTWRQTVGVSDPELADQIQRDEIDILVDIAGHTAGNRLPVFAAKPAGVQVSFLGYPTTSGLRRIDYFLTDSERDSADTEGFYTEQLVYLPQGACCFEAPSDVPVAAAPHLSNGYTTFGSAHRLEKMSPDCLTLWGRVLEQSPNARLLLFRDVLASAATRGRVLQQLQAAGVDTNRVDFAWELPPNHLDIYARFDILLDVFPWGSGATAYESMWMGVPIPTIRGDRSSSRATASLMHHCGLPELCADSTDDYVALVTHLAANSERLQQLRQSIRPMMQATVCNGKQFAEDIEQAFMSMLSATGENCS